MDKQAPGAQSSTRGALITSTSIAGLRKVVPVFHRTVANVNILQKLERLNSYQGRFSSIKKG